MEKAGEQEGDSDFSDFSDVNFDVLEGHPIRNIQEAFGNSWLKPENLGLQIWKALAFIDRKPSLVVKDVGSEARLSSSL